MRSVVTATRRSLIFIGPGQVATFENAKTETGEEGWAILFHPERAAATQVMVATLPSSELVNGAYYADCKVIEEAKSAKNMDDAKKLFDYCDRVTKQFQ